MSERDKLAKIVGNENVFDDPETLESYSKDGSFVHKIRPRCIVKPKDLGHIQAIVKWANDTRTPLVPVSSGPPRFRGDTIPGVGGAVIVDVSQMKRIIRVDRRNRVAMVEPGVTFAELIPELNKNDLAPFMPLVPRSSKSVVASGLEREPITVPRHHWDVQDPVRCIEIIYGSGDLFRTGSAAGPGSIEEQWEVGRAQVRGIGPAHTDFARLIQGAQGTMGIVTWVSIACRPLPKLKKTFLVPADKVEALTGFIYKLLWKKLGEDYILLNNHNLACLLTDKAETFKELKASLPPWVFIFSIEGFGLLPEERVGYQEAEFIEVAQSFGLQPTAVLQGMKAETITDVLARPSKEPYWKVRVKGGCHDIFFLTTLDKTPEFIRRMYEVAEVYHYPTEEIGIYLQPTVQGTNCHCEFNLMYDPQNHAEVDRVRMVDYKASRLFSSLGGFFSRPYGSWAEVAFGGAADVITASRKVKDIFDPKGVMNPGKLCF